MIYIRVSKINYHWLRWRLVPKPLSEPMVTYCQFLGNKPRWHFNQNTTIFIQDNKFANVVCELVAILSRSQCVKLSRVEHTKHYVVNVGMYYRNIYTCIQKYMYIHMNFYEYMQNIWRCLCIYLFRCIYMSLCIRASFTSSSLFYILLDVLSNNNNNMITVCNESLSIQTVCSSYGWLSVRLQCVSNEITAVLH